MNAFSSNEKFSMIGYGTSITLKLFTLHIGCIKQRGTDSAIKTKLIHSQTIYAVEFVLELKGICNGCALITNN